jgi:ribosomal protein S18 acetylase RimI-like enzyme
MLYVSPAHRGEGLARALLRTAQEAARREGLGGLWAYFPLRVPAAFLAATGGRAVRTLRLFRREEIEGIPAPHIPQGYGVRPLVPPADLEAAASLYNTIFDRMWNFRPLAAKDVAAWFEGEDTRAENCLLLETRPSASGPAALLGLAVLAVDPVRLRAGDATAYVPDIGVRPEFRGRGWGEVLIAAAAARARELGLTALELIADEADAGVRAFYREQGFREEGALHVYEWPIPEEDPKLEDLQRK